MILPDYLPPFRAIGLMSGTSVDGVDACGLTLQVNDGRLQVETEATHSHLIPPALREALLKVMADKGCAFETLIKLDLAVGHLFAEAAQALMTQAGWGRGDVQAIGSHGQTLYHLPPVGSLESLWGDSLQWFGASKPLRGQRHPVGGTLQIGSAEVIAERTGVKTVSNFRPRDMVAGGQGAPLVSLADVLLLQASHEIRCVQNIGGIANVTVVPPAGGTLPYAFDTGPGNMLMDAASSCLFQAEFDADGAFAAQGTCQEIILEALMQDAYLSEPAPKTTGRERFGVAFWQTLQAQYPGVAAFDWLATLNRFTAESIAQAYADHVLPGLSPEERRLPFSMVIGGGGGRNPVLLANIQQACAQRGISLEIHPHESFGISSQYKEALAFGVLAWATCHGIAGNVPTCTGATEPVILGHIIPA